MTRCAPTTKRGYTQSYAGDRFQGEERAGFWGVKPAPAETFQTVYTRGKKLRYRAKYHGAPLRKSEWSAFKDGERKAGRA